MAKTVTGYFSRVTPFYLLSKEEMSDSEAFDAYPVQVQQATLDNAKSMRRLVQYMELIFMDNPAPEEAAELEAGLYEAQVRKIFKTRAQ